MKNILLNFEPGAECPACAPDTETDAPPMMADATAQGGWLDTATRGLADILADLGIGGARE